MVQFASYLRRFLCKTRLIFPRINGPILTPLFQRTAHESHAQQAKLQELENQIKGLRKQLKDAETEAMKVIYEF